MLRKTVKFNTQCQTDLSSIQNPQRTLKPDYKASINNPLKQQFSNIRLASTLSIGRTNSKQQDQKLRQDYNKRTGQIRITDDDEVREELFQINLANMSKKYDKYRTFDQMNIPKEIVTMFDRLGYHQINQFMRMSAVHLLFEAKSILQFDNPFERDAIIALVSIAFIKRDALHPQVLIISATEEQAIQIEVIINQLNVYYQYIYRVSNLKSIVQDRKYLREAQIVIGTCDRVDYVIQQKYLLTMNLDSIIFQDFTLSCDLNLDKNIEHILNMVPKSCSKHIYFNEVFTEKEHQILMLI